MGRYPFSHTELDNRKIKARSFSSREFAEMPSVEALQMVCTTSMPIPIHWNNAATVFIPDNADPARNQWTGR